MKLDELRRLSRMPSDAPLRSALVELPEGGTGLLRALDEPWTRDAAARRLFVAEIDRYGRAGPSRGLLPLLASGETPEPWSVREHLPGATVRELLAGEAGLSEDQLLWVLDAALAGLDELHRLGLAHGDPSPRNLVLSEEGEPFLCDASSSRRLFAGGALLPSGDAARAADLGTLFAWARRAVRLSTTAADGELRLALDTPSSDEVRAAAVRRLVARRPRQPLPVDPPALPAFDRPAAVPVVVAVGPIAEDRVRYVAAKALSTRAAKPVVELRASLATAALDVASTYPEPARTLVAELEGLGIAPVEIRRGGAARGS